MIVKPNFTVIKALAPHFKGWCVWKYEIRQGGGKPGKAPFIGSGTRGKVSEPGAWPCFEAVEGLYDDGGGDGVGVVMAGAVGDVIAIDVDGCLLADGTVKPEAAEVVRSLSQVVGWLEVSPSGTGLRAFCLGTLPEWLVSERKQQTWGAPVEVYRKASSRYVSATGVLFSGSAGAVRSIEAADLEAFLKVAGFGPEVGQTGVGKGAAKEEGEGVEVERSDAEVLKLLHTHNKRGRVTRLLDGDTSDHDGDHSTADMELCCEIAYFTRDAVQIDRIFRQSGLMRDKWDEYRGAKKYGVITIAEAIKRQGRNYDEDQAAKKQGTKAAAKRAAALKTQESYLAGGAEELKTEKGAILKGIWAASELLIRDRRLVGAVFFDEFSDMTMKARSFREAFEDRSATASLGGISDADISTVRVWLAHKWGLDLTTNDAKECLQRWARQCSRNPVVERLEECQSQWVKDGSKPRLKALLKDYFAAKTEGGEGEDISLYVEEVGRRWFIQAVARAFNPGCQADSMLILEGGQGARKSSAARVLCEAISEKAFLEGFSLNGDTQQNTLMKLSGTLIAEWGELAGLGKHDSDLVKQFVTQRTDTYRKPFDCCVTEHKRTVTFLASTNEGQYLRDLTGNRRFWPVTVGRIDIDRLKEDAPLLWGEAVAEYQAGARYWIDETGAEDAALSALTLAEQRRRLSVEHWDELALDLAELQVKGELVSKLKARGHDVIGGPGIAMLMELSGMEGLQSDVSGQRGQRFSRALKKAGWESYKSGGRVKWKLTDEADDAIRRRLEIPKPKTKGSGMRKGGGK